ERDRMDDAVNHRMLRRQFAAAAFDLVIMVNVTQMDFRVGDEFLQGLAARFGADDIDDFRALFGNRVRDVPRDAFLVGNPEDDDRLAFQSQKTHTSLLPNPLKLSRTL